MLGAVELDQAVAGQRLGQIQRPVLLQPGDLGGGLDGPAAGEDGHDLQQRPLGVIQQAHAPLHRGPQGPLPLGHVHGARPQRVQRCGQPVKQRAGVQQPGARGRQLDGQRQAVQAAADRHHRRRVGLGEGEVGPDRAGAVHKQRHRRRGHQLRQRHASGGRPAGRPGSGSGGTGYSRSARNPSTVRLVASDDHAGAVGQQLVQVAGGAGDLLQVVQDEQPGAVPQLLGQGLQRRARPGQVGAHRPADAAHDQLRRGDPGQRDEHGAGTEAATCPFAHGQRQPGLADPARPGQRHQPHPRPGEQAGQLADGLLPPDQRGGVHRQRARAALRKSADRREVGREVGVGQLVDQLGLGQIAQPELAQPLQAEPAAQPPCHQVAGGLGDQHLPAVRGGFHPGTAVDRRVVDIVALLHMRLAGVQPHPHPQRGTRRPRLRLQPKLAGAGRLDRGQPRWQRRRRNCHPPRGR